MKIRFIAKLLSLGHQLHHFAKEFKKFLNSSDLADEDPSDSDLSQLSDCLSSPKRKQAKNNIKKRKQTTTSSTLPQQPAFIGLYFKYIYLLYHMYIK
jgi:hypothetical protein